MSPVQRLLSAAGVCAASAIALAAPGITASAQDRTLDDCRAIEDDSARLSCYDEVTRAGTAADRDAPVRTAAPQPPEDPVEEFGAEKVVEAPVIVEKPASQPRVTEAEGRGGLLSIFGAEKIAKDEEDELQSITMEIASFRLQPYGELVVTLENGQVWRQLEPSRSITRAADEESVKSATIERAALGSYRMKIMPMDRTMKVRRVQ